MGCARERFRGELFGEDLEENLEGRRGDEGRSLLNDRTTSGEEGKFPDLISDNKGL